MSTTSLHPIIVALAAGVCVLGACAPDDRLTDAWAGPPEAAAAIGLRTLRLTVTDPTLTASNEARLASFLSGLPEAADLVVYLADPGRPARVPRDTTLADTLLSQIRRWAPAAAVAFTDDVPDTRPSPPMAWPAAEVTIYARNVAAARPTCAMRRGIEAPAASSQLQGNLGCANAYNLGLMAAYPGDLLRGRDLAAASGSREADAITRYRTDKIKELGEEPTAP